MKSYYLGHIGLIIALLSELVAVESEASPRDSFGVDADAVSHAMAVTAGAMPLSAASTNPARLMDAAGIEAAFDLVVAEDRLRINHEKSGNETYVGYQFEIAAALPLGKYRDRLFVGLDAHLPNDGLYEVSNTAPATPVIFHTGSEARRFSLDAAIAVRIWERISIGAGIMLMPSVTANVNIDFSGAGDTSSSLVNVDYHVAPVIGVYAEPVEGLHLGLSYRGAIQLALDVPAEVYISDAIGAIHAQLVGAAYSEPHEISIGVKYDFSKLVKSHLARFAVELDADYLHYAHDVATSADVRLYGDDGELLNSTDFSWQPFEDAWSIRAAFSWMPMDELAVTLGYAFEKSPISAQRSVFNVLDADRNQIAFGVTGWLPDEWLGDFDIGFSTGAKIDLYSTRDMEKYEYLSGNPGFPSIRFEGMAFAWHGTIMMRFQ